MTAHLSLGPARETVLSRASQLPSEAVPLTDALGRTLASGVTAPHNQPPFDNSAMDGFALRCADTLGATTENPVVLELVGESRAGAPGAAVLGEGQATKISTGAALPAGADCVLRVEDASPAGEGRIALSQELPPGHDIRTAGTDVAIGTVVVAAGTLLGAGEIAMLASVGAASIECVRRPRVAILTTGDELVAPGGELRHGQIFDSNSAMLDALVRECGGEVVALVAAVADDPESTNRAVAALLGGDGAAPDVLICCGGVSVGEHDHVKDALAAAGVTEHFWQVAMRPGHPTYFGERVAEKGGANTLVFGLPGNPVSSYATFHMFAAPALRALSGLIALKAPIEAELAEPLSKPPGHTLVLRCTLTRSAGGVLTAAPTSANQRSY